MRPSAPCPAVADEPREFRLEPRFDAELRAIEPDPRRADLILEGIERDLRDPAWGTRIPGTAVWFIAIKRGSFLPPYVVFYAFNRHTVALLSIRRFPWASRNGDSTT